MFENWISHLLILSSFLWIEFLILSLGLFYLLTKVFREQFKHRKIFDMNSSTSVQKRELRNSVRTIFIANIIAIVIYVFYELGWTQIYISSPDNSIFYIFLSVIIIHTLHDAYFYWTHRWMHEVSWMKKLHRVHHQSKIPSPLSALSFSTGEAIVQYIFFLIIAIILPVHWGVLVFFFTFLYWINVWGHTEFEFWPNGLYRLPYGSSFNTITHHNLHHYDSTGNYSLYYRFWDEKCGTLNEKTYPQFYKIRSQIETTLGNEEPVIRPLPSDTVGLYFEQQKVFGEDINIHAFDEAGNLQKTYPHSLFDGTSALADYLKERGAKITKLPKYSNRTKISRVKNIINTAKWFFSLPYISDPWKKKPVNVKNSALMFKLSVEETELALKRAKEKNVSFNSFCLSCLSEATSDYRENKREQIWLIPVSMRDFSQGLESVKGNEVTFLDLKFSNNGSEFIQNKLNHAIKNGLHEVGANSFKLLDFFMRSFFILFVWSGNLFLRRNGLFSNLGSFEIDQDLSFYFLPPTLTVTPFAVFIMTLNKRLHISFNVHKKLGIRDQDLQVISKKYKENLLYK